MAGQIFSPLAHWVGGAGALQDNGGQKVPLPGILGRMGAEPPTSAGYTSLTAFWAGHTGAEYVAPSRFVLSPSNLALSGTGTLAGTLVFNYILDLDPGVELSPTGTLTLSGSVTFTSFASLAGYSSLQAFWMGGAGTYAPLTLAPSELALSGTGGLSGDITLSSVTPTPTAKGGGYRYLGYVPDEEPTKVKVLLQDEKAKETEIVWTVDASMSQIDEAIKAVIEEMGRLDTTIERSELLRKKLKRLRKKRNQKIILLSIE